MAGRHPRSDENSLWYPLLGDLRGRRPVCDWCPQARKELDPDVLRHPKLSSPILRRTRRVKSLPGRRPPEITDKGGKDGSR